jgi:hypothetical protein
LKTQRTVRKTAIAAASNRATELSTSMLMQSRFRQTVRVDARLPERTVGRNTPGRAYDRPHGGCGHRTPGRPRRISVEAQNHRARSANAIPRRPLEEALRAHSVFTPRFSFPVS